MFATDSGAHCRTAGYGNTAAEVVLAQASVLLFAIVMPLAHLAATLAVWLAPIRSNWLPFVTTLSHVLLSWAALDVFIFSIVVGFLQVSLFAGFIVGPKCNALAPLLASPKIEVRPKTPQKNKKFTSTSFLAHIPAPPPPPHAPCATLCLVPMLAGC